MARGDGSDVERAGEQGAGKQCGDLVFQTGRMTELFTETVDECFPEMEARWSTQETCEQFLKGILKLLSS